MPNRAQVAPVGTQIAWHGSSAMRDVVSMPWDAHSPIAALITLKRDSQCTPLVTYDQSSPSRVTSKRNQSYNGAMSVLWYADDIARSAGAMLCDMRSDQLHARCSSACPAKSAGQSATRGSNEDDNFEGVQGTVCHA